MTNKEKYPNAEVRSVNDKYYVSLDGKSHYLVDGKPNKDCTGGWFKTKTAAQKALDKFMNGPKPEITLSEIKSQLEEAKKLVGKEIKGPVNNIFVVEEVVLNVVYERSSFLCEDFFEKNGYVITVRGGDYLLPYTPDMKTVEPVSAVVAHDGKIYTAESDGTGNRKIQKITIGACDFDRKTLKSLVELEISNNMFTLDQIKSALFGLINKDANTGIEKEANDFLLDCFNEAQKLIAKKDAPASTPS